MAQIKIRARHGFIAVTIFAVIVASLALFRYYSTAELVNDGEFFRDELMSTDMLTFWKELGEE